MSLGRVHLWVRSPEAPLGGRVETRVVTLENLGERPGRLWGKFVRVGNAGWLNEPGADGGGADPKPLGDASADAAGSFLNEHGRGGPRVDKYTLRSEKYRRRYIDAARFGEVNAYYHIDRIASYLHGLLVELGAPSLPRVGVLVNAHHAAVIRDGVRDGDWREEHWVPFEGGHYRLPSPRNSLREFDPIAPDGEIHLGAGRHLLEHGALVDAIGARYRHNAAHNAGIIYHEYGHHVARHTADFLANAQRPREHQNNLKTALDEGYCDYWAATMLDVPYIWVFHRSHRVELPHARSLTSTKTAADFDRGAGADPHANGTIWAAALWDLRKRLSAGGGDGARRADKIVLQSLLVLGRLPADEAPTRSAIRRARASFSSGLAAVLQADEQLHGGAHHAQIVATFHRRGIEPEAPRLRRAAGASATNAVVAGNRSVPIEDLPEIKPESPLLGGLHRHLAIEDIPDTRDLLSGAALSAQLESLREAPYSLIAVGDVMLGARLTSVLAERGTDYPFAAVAPLLRRAPIVLGNLEGPLAKRAPKQPRNYSYRVRPDLAATLVRAGFNVMTLANNHLLDCGRAGVIETLEALSSVDLAAVGAGVDHAAAHVPTIVQAGPIKVGLLGYYWNRRTSATDKQPGSAMDSPKALHADISALRERVDRVVVTFHWGVPYEREPLPDDRRKARIAIELGADAVIGHHTHVVQPFEVYRGRPILYGVGNFAFGSANSRAEGLLIALRFDPLRTAVEIFPLYVKNRDPRVDYQPKVMCGTAAKRCLSRLARASGASGELLAFDSFRGVLDLPWTQRSANLSSARAG